MKLFKMITERIPGHLRFTMYGVGNDSEAYVDLTKKGCEQLRDVLTEYLSESK